MMLPIIWLRKFVGFYMSDSYRTVEEYARLYAIKHNITIEEAMQTVMVKSFEEYINNGGQKQ